MEDETKELYREIARLQLRCQRAESKRAKAEARATEAEEQAGWYQPSGHMKDPWGNGTLPVPRMQMHYLPRTDSSYPFTAVVALIYRHRLGHVVVQPLSSTNVGGDPEMKLYAPEYELYDPFRDGVHLRSNAVNLKLPCYKVNGDMIQKIEPDFVNYVAKDIKEPIGEPAFRMKDIKFPPVAMLKVNRGDF